VAGCAHALLYHLSDPRILELCLRARSRRRSCEDTGTTSAARRRRTASTKRVGVLPENLIRTRTGERTQESVAATKRPFCGWLTPTDTGIYVNLESWRTFRMASSGTQIAKTDDDWIRWRPT